MLVIIAIFKIVELSMLMAKIKKDTINHTPAIITTISIRVHHTAHRKREIGTLSH